MNISPHKYPLSVLLLAFTIILAVTLTSCGSTEPTSTLIPTVSPRATTTYTPEPPTDTPEPESDDGGGSILLPSSTPAATATPGVITDLVSQFAEATGLYETTFFWVSVEDWINLAISIILALIVGFLLSRLVFYALKKAVAKTETQYDDAFIKVLRHQISLIFIVVGFQIGVLRLPFIDVTIKQVLNQFFIAIYVIAATIIVWRLLDVLVEWYQNDVEPKREPHQTDTLLLLLHRLARTLLVTISLILLLSLYNINVNALIAALGIGGLAISLGAQDTLSNIISGVMIMSKSRVWAPGGMWSISGCAPPASARAIIGW